MLDREKEQSEKKAYNERLEQLKELEKMKEMSYKNVHLAANLVLPNAHGWAAAQH